MTEKDDETAAAILAELKAINKNLAHLRAAADHYLRVENNKKRAMEDALASLPNLNLPG